MQKRCAGERGGEQTEHECDLLITSTTCLGAFRSQNSGIPRIPCLPCIPRLPRLASPPAWAIINRWTATCSTVLFKCAVFFYLHYCSPRRPSPKALCPLSNPVLRR